MPQLMITGVEATQSTQIFRSNFLLCNGQSCPDNSIPLVANRNTILRVYVSGATPGNYIGAAVINTSGQGPPGFPSLRVGTPVIARAQPPQRVSASETVQIDFLVQTPGTWRFAILAEEIDTQWNTLAFSPVFPIILTFYERRCVRIRLVRIRYRNIARNLNLGAPTVQDFWAALDFAHRALPVRMPGFQIVHESEEPYDGDFTRIDPSAHDPTWAGFAGNNGTTGNLLNIMDRLVAAESLPGDVIYIGIYPNGARQSVFSGWAVSRWVISDRNPQTLAHELAHKLCVPQHAPCGNPANVDASYPTYGALPAGSIGEVGFDPLLGVTYDPASTRDLMTYCGSRWISPYNYRKIFDCLTPLPAPAEKPPLVETDSFKVVMARFPDRWVKVDLPAVPQRPLFAPPNGTWRALVIVRDAHRGELGTLPAKLDPASLESDPGQLGWLNAEIPVLRNAAFFDVQVEGEIVFREEIGGRAPALKVKWPSASDLREGFGKLTWTVKGRADYIIVRTTCDGGETWIARILPGKQRSLALESGFLRSGAECRIEVLALCGYRASRSVSQRFVVGRHPAPLLIVSPSVGAVHSPGRPLRLLAVSHAADGRISWFSDLDGKLGDGAFITAPPLQPGRHMIEARSDQPFETPAQVMIVVKEKPLRTPKGGRRASV